MSTDRFHKAFLLVLVVGVSAGLLAVLWPFVVTILLAAIFAGLSYPIYVRLVEVFGGHRALASLVTLLLVFTLVIVPLLALVGVVVNQALQITETIRPAVERLIQEPTLLGALLERLPGYEYVAPYREDILLRLGDVVDAVGRFLVASLSEVTRGTVAFVFHFFILLYTMFFFLMDGPLMLRGMLDRLPLRDTEKQQMVARFMSVTRATVKGTLIIGVLQGGLAGLAFAVAGVPNALFWTVVMVVLSIVPVIGAALVWVPATIILIATGQVLTGILLAAFCGVIVSSVDNILRPRLVGRDTRMHDLIILFSTLGGIFMWGPIGFILGPILAGLFVTSWEIFAAAYGDALQERS